MTEWELEDPEQAGMGRLDRVDRGTPSRLTVRNQWGEPGDLIHADVKKLAAILPGCGWRTLRHDQGRKNNCR